MDKEDGGSAFPSLSVHTDRNGEVYSERIDGMPLRDYFAAKAMQALIAKTPIEHTTDHRSPQVLSIAVGAYDYADSMLKVRFA